MKRLWERARSTWWGRLLSDVVVFGAIILVMGAWQSRTHLKDVVAPSPSLATLEGGEVALSSFRGQPVMLAFWAPWCTVCKAETQNISWVRKLAGENAHVVSVVSGYEQVSQVRAFVQERGVDYPVLLGSDALAREFKVEAFPTVYFLDGEGRVKHSVVGYTTTAGLLARLFL
jgi:thiol-disulfide isomerase/thioredoxin